MADTEVIDLTLSPVTRESSASDCVVTADTVLLADGRVQTWPVPSSPAIGELCCLCDDQHANKQLPCKHTLCQKCVISMFQKRRELPGMENVSYATCPWCRAGWTLDEVQPREKSCPE